MSQLPLSRLPCSCATLRSTARARPTLQLRAASRPYQPFSSNPQTTPSPPQPASALSSAPRSPSLPSHSPLRPTLRTYATRTIQQARARHSTGPFSFRAAALFVATGAGLYYYFTTEKARVERQRIANHSKGIGKPKVGGPFELLDQHGNAFSSEELKGRYSLVYFGFSHCPDICPDELDKMSRIIDLCEGSISKRSASKRGLQAIVISCDPARDSPAVWKTYLAEFHEKMVGLTGTYEQIKDVCKKYRVYFSTPPELKPGDDYLVDHSIYFYLMDPEGDFVEAIGRQHSPEDATKLILEHVGDWKGQLR